MLFLVFLMSPLDLKSYTSCDVAVKAIEQVYVLCLCRYVVLQIRTPAHSELDPTCNANEVQYTGVLFFSKRTKKVQPKMHRPLSYC